MSRPPVVKRPPPPAKRWWKCPRDGSKWDAAGEMGISPAGRYGYPPKCPRCGAELEPPA